MIESIKTPEVVNGKVQDVVVRDNDAYTRPQENRGRAINRLTK